MLPTARHAGAALAASGIGVLVGDADGADDLGAATDGRGDAGGDAVGAGVGEDAAAVSRGTMLTDGRSVGCAVAGPLDGVADVAALEQPTTRAAQSSEPASVERTDAPS